MKRFRLVIAGVLLLLGIWSGVTLDTMRETGVDVDLGVAPSSLPLWEAAVWSLPLSLVVWFACVGLGFLVFWFRSMFAGKT